LKDSQPRKRKFAKSLWLLVLLVPVILSFVGRAGGEIVFINGEVLTIDSAQPLASALGVRGGRITAVGSDQDVLDQASDDAHVIDLQGRTLIPGFVDAHSHFPVSGLSAVSVNIAPPPIGPGASKQAVIDAIAAVIPKTPGTHTDDLILGFNYDNTAFDNPVHPTRAELDAISNGHPVYLWHNSGHLGVANSAALKQLGIDKHSPPIDGGERGVDEAGELNGLLAETAAPGLTTLLKQLSWRDQWRIVTDARQTYLRSGVTTVQNGFASVSMRRLLNALHWVGLLPQRPVTWLAHDKLDPDQVSDFPKNTTIKLIVDGSPQGLTAYLTEPFLVPAFGPENRGIEIYTQEALNELVIQYHKLGYQLALHGNGDAAIDQIITAVTAAQAAYPRPDPRHVLVHAQILRPDQVRVLGEIGITPSFFTTHTFYWGDWHLRTLGDVRAEGLSPAATAADSGLRFSLHADTPVTPIDPLMVMWAATERQTRSGVVLGAAEQIERALALRAVTLDAAWQAFLEDEIGSLEVGKRADLAVLSENPITVDDLRSLVVEQTWVAGKRHH